MTNREILTAAIEKAIANGWEGHATEDDGYAAETVLSSYTDPHYPAIKELIFDHDFAKALWDNEEVWSDELHQFLPDWKLHLQQMVISPDPIKYLKEHI